MGLNYKVGEREWTLAQNFWPKALPIHSFFGFEINSFRQKARSILTGIEDFFILSLFTFQVWLQYDFQHFFTLDYRDFRAIFGLVFQTTGSLPAFIIRFQTFDHEKRFACF
jgi:hypothetical protein